MALKRDSNGRYIVKSKKDLAKALELSERLRIEIQEIQEKYGLTELMADATEAKKAATSYMANNDINEIRDLEGGKYAKLITASKEKQFILTSDDIDDGTPSYVVPLRKILLKKFGKGSKAWKNAWNMVTKRVPDPEGIDMAVSSGLLTVDEIAPSFVETFKASYVRIYDEAGGE